MFLFSLLAFFLAKNALLRKGSPVPATTMGLPGSVPRPKAMPSGGQWLPCYLWFPNGPNSLPTGPPPLAPPVLAPVAPPPPPPAASGRRSRSRSTDGSPEDRHRGKSQVHTSALVANN